MLIGTFFRRPKAPVDLPNSSGGRKIYYFTPIDPSNPDSEHVCDVADPVHIQTLLGIKEGYYVSQAESAIAAAASVAAQHRAPVPQHTPVAPPPPAPVLPPIDPMDAGTISIDSQVSASALESTPAPPSASDSERANELVQLKLAELKAALPNQPRSVVELALALEMGRPEEDQRPTFIKNLQQALKG